jgi:hypothetical protein
LELKDYVAHVLVDEVGGRVIDFLILLDYFEEEHGAKEQLLPGLSMFSINSSFWALYNLYPTVV